MFIAWCMEREERYLALDHTSDTIDHTGAPSVR